MDGVENGLCVLQQIVIPASQYSKPLECQKSASGLIMLALLAVLPSIQFNYELAFDADKVYDIGCDYMLTPKFISTHPSISEVLPKALFRVGSISAQLSR